MKKDIPDGNSCKGKVEVFMKARIQSKFILQQQKTQKCLVDSLINEHKRHGKRKFVPYRNPDKISYLECILKQVLDREKETLLDIYLYIYVELS